MSKIQMTEIQQIIRRKSTFKRGCNSFILSPECALSSGLVRGEPGHGRPCHHHQQDLHPFLKNQQTVSAQLDVQGNVFLLRRQLVTFLPPWRPPLQCRLLCQVLHRHSGDSQPDFLSDYHQCRKRRDGLCVFNRPLRPGLPCPS